MIEKSFDISSISVVEFGIRTKENRYFIVPIDENVQNILLELLRDNLSEVESIEGPWEGYSVSEEYSGLKKLVVSMNDELMRPVKTIFEYETAPDRGAEVLKEASQVDIYFVNYWDKLRRKLMAVRKASRFKGVLSKKDRLTRLTDGTLKLVEGDVFRLEGNFDAIFDGNFIVVLNPGSFEYIAELKYRVAAAAVSKVEEVSKALPFLDFSRVKERIASHPKTARLMVSVAKRPDLDQVKAAEVEAMAVSQGIKLQKRGEILRPRVADHHKFLEILDDRRYTSKITGKEIPFIARSRVRTKEG